MQPGRPWEFVSPPQWVSSFLFKNRATPFSTSKKECKCYFETLSVFQAFQRDFSLHFSASAPLWVCITDMEILWETSGKGESDQKFVGYWNLLCLPYIHTSAHSPKGRCLCPFKALGRLLKHDPGEILCRYFAPWLKSRDNCGSHHPLLSEMLWYLSSGFLLFPLLPPFSSEMLWYPSSGFLLFPLPPLWLKEPCSPSKHRD